MTFQRLVQFALSFLILCLLLALLTPAWLPSFVIGGGAAIGSAMFSDPFWAKIYEKFPDLPKLDR